MRYILYATVIAISAVISFSFFVSIAVVIEKQNGFITYQVTQQQNGGENNKGFWHVFCHDPTAFFTGALFFATVALALATIALIVITQRGIKDQGHIAMESTKVALQAANASSQTAASERAWLTFSAFDTGDYIDGMVNDELIKKGILVSISFVNSGRSPAIMRSSTLGQGLFPIEGPFPDIKPHIVHKGSAAIIGPGMLFSTEMFIFNDAQSYLVLSMKNKIMLHVRLEYDTIFEKSRHTEISVVIQFHGGWIEKNGVKAPAFVGGPAGPNNTIS